MDLTTLNYRDVPEIASQAFQNKVMRNTVNASWYVFNSNLHRDLGIPTMKEKSKICCKHKMFLLKIFIKDI